MIKNTTQNLHLSDLPELRKALRKNRRNLSESEQQAHALSIANRFLQLHQTESVQHIGMSLSFDGEVDLLPLSLALRKRGNVKLYLPIIDINTGEMQFYHWPDDATLKKNCYGILEPEDTTPIPVEQLNLLLVPLVGVDHEGNRLGMGGGYYDRNLSNIHPRPYLMGIAHQCQQVERLPTQPWDIPLDALITESQLTIWRPWPWQ